MKGLRRAAALALCLLTLAALCGCKGKEPERRARFINGEDGFAGAVLETLPEFENAGETVALTRLHPGELVDATDAAAQELTRLGGAAYWYPLTRITAVIAVDRDATAAKIEGWSDIAQAGTEVCLGDGWEKGLLLAAVSYGLEGEDFTLGSAVRLLRGLQREKRLKHGGFDAPVTICFDFQAAQLRLEGRNIEIILPREGTLTFERGLLSSEELTFSEELGRRLREAGFRLVSGDCEAELYPPEEEYARAAQLEDYGRMNELCQDCARLIRRRVERTRLYSSADQREHILVAAALQTVVTIWLYSVVRRTAKWEIRYIATLTGIMLVGWIALRCIKYQLSKAELLGKLCWYGYYIFILGLPLCLLALALVVDGDAASRRKAAGMAALVAAYIAMLAMIFTNDVHMLVFRFEPGGDWSADYSYGAGYYIVIAAAVAELTGAVALLFRKARCSPRRYGTVFPLALAALLLFYSAGYAAGIKPMRDSDFTITMCAFGVMFFESAMRSGLIPSNTGYAELFSASPLNMQLIDGTGEKVLAAAGAAPLPEEVRRLFAVGKERQVELDEDTVVYADKITGGTVTWQEDRSSLNRLYAELRATKAQLTLTNAILAREERRRRSVFGEEERSRLFEQMEREISDRLSELSEMIRGMPQDGGRGPEMARIMLLLCYIKRRCNMYFIGSGDEDGRNMPCNDLGVYLDELADFVAYSGVRCVVNFLLRGEIPLTQAILIYDFVYDSLRYGADNGVGALLETAAAAENGICLGITASGGLDAEFISDGAWELIERTGASVELIAPEDCAGLRLMIPEGGGENA